MRRIRTGRPGRQAAHLPRRDASTRKHFRRVKLGARNSNAIAAFAASSGRLITQRDWAGAADKQLTPNAFYLPAEPRIKQGGFRGCSS
jgi:hypothetical protein